MGKVSDLHNKAMECVDHAVMERRRGNEKRATEFFEQALKFELNAIDALDDQNGLSWSILHRSAGWLALDCDKPRLAEELARKALAGNPHPKIAEELRDLLKETINWEAAYAMQDKETMFLLYAVSEGLCRYIDDFSTHFDFEGSIEDEIQTLVVAGFLEENDGHLDVTERGRFVLGDLANPSKSPGLAESHIQNVNDHIIKSLLREPLRDIAFDELWRFDPARETESSVFNWGEQLEDMQTESPPQQVSVKPKKFSSPASEDSEPSQRLILAERSIASSVYRESERLLTSQHQASHWHAGGSVSKFGLKVAV